MAIFYVGNLGAKGDGVTDDTVAFQAALNRMNAFGGGDVRVPATGKPYLIAGGLVVPNNVRLIGEQGGPTWHGYPSDPNLWPRLGAWLKFTSLTTVGITMAGAGSKLENLNFINAQPVPSATPGVAWTPTTYPYVVRVTQNFVGLEKLYFVGATHGINWDLAETTSGGAFSYIRDVFMGAFSIGIRFKNINDVMNLDNIHHRNLFYVSNPNVIEYMLTNSIGWDIQYIDNPMMNNIEFLELKVAMKFTNSRVNAGGFDLTAAAQHMQGNNFQFSLCEKAMEMASSATVFTGMFTNVLAQSDDVYNHAAQYFFDLNANGVDVMFSNFRVPDVGKGLMRVGGGTGGRVQIANLKVDMYSTMAAGSDLIFLAAGAKLDLPTGLQSVRKTVGSGVKINSFNVEAAVEPLTIFGEIVADRDGGTVALKPSASGVAATGSIEFRGINTDADRSGSGTRRGFVGDASTVSITFAADAGDVYLQVLTAGKDIVVRNSAGVEKATLDTATGNLSIDGTLTENA